MLTAALLAVTLAAPAASAPQSCASASQIVDEAYHQVLERAPDASSAGFVTALQSGRMTVRDLVAQLARSREHLDRFFWQPLVTAVYRQVLQRNPTQQELEQATAQLSGRSMTVTQLVANTATRAANGEEDAVRILYRRLLGRDPDPSGLQAYTQMARTQGIDAVARAIVASPEYQQHAGSDQIPAQDFAAYQSAVTTLYRHVLGRAPDPAGLRDLTTMAATQGIDAVVTKMIDSPEYARMYGNDVVPGHPDARMCQGVGTTGVR